MPRLTYVALTLTAGILIGCGSGTQTNGTDGTQAGARVSGGGATFVDPILQKWAGEYHGLKGVQIDYVKSGSGQGISGLTAGTLDFGCSDAPMTKKELDAAVAKGGPVLHVPLTMGAVAVVYNLPGVADLKLTGPVIADIYLGKVARWNDKAIADLNPGASLPDEKIVPVQRAESSGTTAIFSDYLSKVSPAFKGTVGASKKMDALKDVTGQKGNDGVAGFVKNNKGAIGYAEVAYAKADNIPVALVRNAAGKYVAPTAEAVGAAAVSALDQKQTAEPFSLHDLTYSLTDAAGDASYPIAGMSYALLFQKQPAGTGEPLVGFLKWVVTDGQKFATELHYAPLPQSLSARCTEKLGTVTFQ